MYTEFKDFNIEVLTTPYTTKRGIVFEKTASISLYGKNKLIAEFKLAYCDPEEIYKKIDSGDEILLDECYIENFSLSYYRKFRNLEERSYVTINEFSARGAVFNSTIETDFSYSNFKGNGISFKECRFINGRVSFQGARLSGGYIDFSDILFKNGEVDFSRANFEGTKIEFKNTIFHDGTKNFKFTVFKAGIISFINTEWGEGEVIFIDTNFGEGNVSFKVARFKAGKIDFHFAKFGKGDISFERTEFGNGKVDFRKVEFAEGKVNFNRSVFGEGDVTFTGSELKNSRMTFQKTDFGNGNLFFEEAEYKSSEVIFNNAQFGEGNVYLTKSLFKNLSLISCHLNQYFDLRVTFCEYINLTDTIARDIVDFSPYDHKVEIGCLNIAGMRLIGRIYIDWYENNVKEIINKQNNTSKFDKAEQFKILKENYHNLGSYNFEDLAYIQFKRNEQKAELQKSLGKSRLNAIWHFPIYGFKFLVIDRMGLYATSPARVITSLITIYFIFSLTHLTCPFLMDTQITCISPDFTFIDRVLTTFYYSLITFTTVGYGDCAPEGFLRAVAAVEGFVGPFMMSYFTVAFARKILR
ncbi:MAG: potassium channel family protein [Bacteroidales bacterium]